MFPRRDRPGVGRRPRLRLPSLAFPLAAIALTVAFLANGIAADGPQRRLPEGFPDLVKGLKATPGCLGVETAQTRSGKQVIFAWFADKAAAVKWYQSEMHREAQKRFFPDRPAHKPLALVPDDVGPILAIASLTLADSAQFARTQLPVSQIAIELYKPLPGGVFLGSRFAPDSLKVKGMLDYTPSGTD